MQGGDVLGAILGDIVDSTHESTRTKTKDFPRFREPCSLPPPAR